MNRDDAFKNGKTTYNTGKPCRRGHMADRYVSTANCVECMKLHSKKYFGDKRKFGTKKILDLFEDTVITLRVSIHDKAALEAFAAALNIERNAIRSRDLALSHPFAKELTVLAKERVILEEPPEPR